MRPSIGRAILGGFVATPVMTAMMYLVVPLFGVRMDIAAMLGSMLGGWTMGLIAHFINGSLLFPLIYAAFAYRFLLGAPALRGALFAVVLWLISQIAVLPMVGAGFFSAHIGGTVAVLASLAGHLVYGILLGAFAGLAPAVELVSKAFPKLVPSQTAVEESVPVRLQR